MQASALSRSTSGAFRAHLSLHIRRFLSTQKPLANKAASSPSSTQCRNFSFLVPWDTDFSGGECQGQKCMMAFRAQFCSGTEEVKDSSTGAVRELQSKILESVKVKRSAPPNAWLWSLIEKCENKDDISLLFDVLQQLRIFRLSNLRIHDNFNCNLCREVAKACTRVGAIDFGKKTLWKHNVYGLSPSVASANHLLSYAKAHKDPKLMVEVMKLLKENDLPLQPSIADFVFSICRDADKWELISKYSKRFLKAEVKLRRTTFDTWMEFAANRGDTESLWKIEELRSKLYKQHTIKTGFSCAKGLLLERKPENAAAIVQVLDQIFPDSKRPEVMAELQRLVSELPSEVIKHQEDKREVLHAALQADIGDMIKCLVGMGVAVNVNTKDLHRTEAMLS